MTEQYKADATEVAFTEEKERSLEAAKDRSVDGGFTLKQQKSIRRRVDIRLCLPLGLMYAISLVDKTNLSSANIAGMSADLQLNVGTRYSTIALVFFCTYIVTQFPGTVLTVKYGAHNVLPILTCVWGVILVGMGLAKQWYDLVIYRLILGIVESVVFPGCLFLLGAWYVRYEVHERYSFFYIVANMGSAFAGLLAYGLMQMKGLGGLNGWQWIFIMEGIITVFVGFLCWVWIVGLPSNSQNHWKFLTKEEAQWMIDRVERDRADSILEPFKLKEYLRNLKDSKVWAFGMLSYCATTVAYAIAYFLPTILQGSMGFTVGQAQCLICPPYMFAALLTWVTGWVGDRYHIRSPIILFCNVLEIVGMLLMAFVSNNGVRYFGVFLATGGVTASVPAIYAYQTNNLRGQWKRGLSTAMMVALGGVGGITGSLVFRSQDYPNYRPGIYACIASAALSCLIIALLTVKFLAANKEAKAGKRLIQNLEGFIYTL